MKFNLKADKIFKPGIALLVVSIYEADWINDTTNLKTSAGKVLYQTKMYAHH